MKQEKKQNKSTYKQICLINILLLMLFFCVPAQAQEITAVDFNGDLIGKVIPDGKVVSFDNQLIGNVTADRVLFRKG